MKQKIYIFFAVTILSVFMAIPSEAGYYMKKKAPVTTSVAASDQPMAEAAAAAAPTESAPTSMTEKKAFSKKQGFFSKVLHKLMGHKADIPQGLYIVMSFFFLGWLAMGLMDDFEGIDWILSLILYFLGIIPGIVYSLVMMHNYY